MERPYQSEVTAELQAAAEARRVEREGVLSEAQLAMIEETFGYNYVAMMLMRHIRATQ